MTKMSTRVSVVLGLVIFGLVYAGFAGGKPAWPTAAALAAVGLGLMAALAVRYREPRNVLGGVILALIFVGAAALREWPDARWLTWTIAAVLATLVLVSMALAVRSVRVLKEYERFVNTEATSLSFFVVATSAGVYGLLDDYLDLPQPSASVVFVYAMCTWAFLRYVVERRLG